MLCRLNRFLTAKKDDARGPKDKRPYLATECHNLHEADKWRYQAGCLLSAAAGRACKVCSLRCLRAQIIKEIGKKVMDIQNAGLGEHK